MNDGMRAALAGLTAAAVNGRPFTSVYDFARSKSVSIDCNVAGGRVDAYDYDRRCYINGTLPSSIFDYGESCFFDMAVQAGGAAGFVYGQNNGHYQASVSGGRVDIYDYRLSRYFHYQVS